MTDNRTIYVDMDDVICETCRGFLQLLEREFDRLVAFAEVTVFDLTVSFGMTREEIEIFMARAHEPDVLETFRPMAGALETLRSWAGRGDRIRIMTGRPPSARAATAAWLARHGVPYDGLEFVDKYGRREADPSFAEALTLDDLARRRYDLAVEDSAAMAAFLSEHGVAPVALIDRPWNRDLSAGGVRRFDGWSDLARTDWDAIL